MCLALGAYKPAKMCQHEVNISSDSLKLSPFGRSWAVSLGTHVGLLTSRISFGVALGASKSRQDMPTQV